MITENIVKELRDFIKDHYVLRDEARFRGRAIFAPEAPQQGAFGKLAAAISSFIEKQRNADTFSVLLNKLREERNLTERDLYKKAWIDKRLSSKIMNTRHYHPSKNTVMAFGLALELEQDEFTQLLESAGYAFSRSSIPDLVVLFCVQDRIYDLHDVNALLLVLEQKALCRE
jgi:hypothetical protein